MKTVKSLTFKSDNLPSCIVLLWSNNYLCSRFLLDHGNVASSLSDQSAAHFCRKVKRVSAHSFLVVNHPIVILFIDALICIRVTAVAWVTRGLSTCHSNRFYSCSQRENKNILYEKSAQEEMQTLCAGCSKVEPKIFRPAANPIPRGVGQPKFNQLEMVITFAYKPSLVRIDARNFELS